MTVLNLRAPAKINWSLEIVGKRDDGYHLLRSIMQMVELFDILRISSATVDSCLRDGAEVTDDLAFRAWMLIKERCHIMDCLRIEIEKHIPVGAGLGGGSSDAATLMLGINRHYDLGLSLEKLVSWGLELGADLPFCLSGGLALVEGIGEKISKLDAVQPYDILIINPGFPVSTSAVFNKFSFEQAGRCPDIDALSVALLAGDVQKICQSSGNMLENAAICIHPELQKIKNGLVELGLHPLMSGSGGSIFALCGSGMEEDSLAIKKVRRLAPWVSITKVILDEFIED